MPRGRSSRAREGALSSVIMRTAMLILAAAIALSSCEADSGAGPVPYPSLVGAYAAESEYDVLIDPSRGWNDADTYRATREIPIKIYAPDASAAGPLPVVVVSHGLGGDVEGLSYLAEDLASCGYIVVAVQHHRSDAEYLAKVGAADFLAAAGQPETRLLRPGDISFVLDRLSDPANTVGAIAHDRMDFSKVAALGHSFGAWTVLACLGQTFDGGIDASDDRFLCGVAFSPQAPGTLGVDPEAWEAVAAPTLTMGGTEDRSPGTSDPADRRAAFDGMPPKGTKYHATIAGAEHSDFGNEGDGTYHEWIAQMTLAFLDATLLGRAAARAWLASEDIEAVSSGGVALERK